MGSIKIIEGFIGGPVVKNPPANAGLYKIYCANKLINIYFTCKSDLLLAHRAIETHELYKYIHNIAMATNNTNW